MADVELALLIDRFLRRIHTSLQAKAVSFDTEDVGPAGGMVLLTLAEMGRPEMHELTARFARDKSQMTRVVKSLEKKGLVIKQTSERDARASVVSLTPKGRDLVATLGQALAESINDVLGPVSDAEKNQLKLIMQRVAGEEHAEES